MDKLFIAVAVCLLAGVATVVLVFLRKMQTGEKFFQPKDRRVGFVERAILDGGRKLILVRRDDVEHLLLVGGPIDLVIETGIKAPVAHAITHADHLHDIMEPSIDFPSAKQAGSPRDQDKPLDLTSAHEMKLGRPQ